MNVYEQRTTSGGVGTTPICNEAMADESLIMMRMVGSITVMYSTVP